jgi:flagellar export protein FliJ
MKKFSFPLGRVMDFRATQARVEEQKLEALYAELRRIADRESGLMRDRLEAEQAVLRGASGSEFSALDSFRRFSVAEHTRLESLRADCSKRIAAQIQVVAAKRRDVRLLERLKDQRHREWTRELDREIDAQADEAFLAKLHRRA